LHYAALGDRRDIAELLIAAGADVNAKNDGGLITPLDYAKHYPETAALLRKHGGKTGEELKAEGNISIHQAAYDGNIEDVKQHLAAGTDVNAKGNLGLTPLHEATRAGRKGIVKLLIAGGADVNAKDSRGRTPLDYAKSKPEIAALLRKHGGKTKKELEAAGN
jgi:ankyrin repeat protein